MQVETKLTDFLPRINLNSIDYRKLDFYFFEPICEYCGNNGNKVVKAGKRENTWKESTQRFECRCGRSFSLGFDSRAHFPRWVWDAVLFYITVGVRYASLPRIIKRESVLRGYKEPFTISSLTARNIVARAERILADFERNVRLFALGGKVLSEEWEIDDRFHNWYKVKPDVKEQIQNFGSRLVMDLNENKTLLESKDTRKMGYWKYMYPIAIVEVKPKYCLPIYVGKTRDTEAATKALIGARDISAYMPKLIRCDGHRPFIEAIKTVYPAVEILSRTKKSDISVINTTENVWSTINLIVPKRRYRAQKYLLSTINIGRHFRNILLPQKSLSYKTPLEALGFDFPSSARASWVSLLQFAYQFNRYIKYLKLKFGEKQQLKSP